MSRIFQRYSHICIFRVLFCSTPLRRLVSLHRFRPSWRVIYKKRLVLKKKIVYGHFSKHELSAVSVFLLRRNFRLNIRSFMRTFSLALFVIREILCFFSFYFFLTFRYFSFLLTFDDAIPFVLYLFINFQKVYKR